MDQDPFNNPFRKLAETLRRQSTQKETAPAQTPAPPPKKASNPSEELFREAVKDVIPLEDDARFVSRASKKRMRRSYTEDDEVREELEALVEGTIRFDLSNSDEFVLGSVEGMDGRILKKLSRGGYPPEAHLDLHGLTREDAKTEVDAFIAQEREKGRRCVLLIHGRGLHSKDQIPVLKNLVVQWLERGRTARSVLAFSTARPEDGGAGALYVLLRRMR